MLEQAIRTYLLSKTQIAAVVGTRIHVGDFVVVDATSIPALGIETENAASQTYADGTPVGLQYPTLRIVCKHATYADSDKLLRLVQAALRGISVGPTVIPTTVDGATTNVTIEQVDLLTEPFNDPEEDYGHAFTIKPRVIRIRVGWRVPTNTI